MLLAVPVEPLMSARHSIGAVAEKAGSPALISVEPAVESAGLTWVVSVVDEPTWMTLLLESAVSKLTELAFWTWNSAVLSALAPALNRMPLPAAVVMVAGLEELS